MLQKTQGQFPPLALQLRTGSNLVPVDIIVFSGLYKQTAHIETYFKCEHCLALHREKRNHVCILMDVKKQTFTRTHEWWEESGCDLREAHVYSPAAPLLGDEAFFFVKARVENYMVISGDLLTWESLFWTNFCGKGFRGCFLFGLWSFFFFKILVKIFENLFLI